MSFDASMSRDVSDIIRSAKWLPEQKNSIFLVGMTDPKRMPDPKEAINALPAGNALIWRAYEGTADAIRLRTLGQAMSRKHGVLLIAGVPRLCSRLGVQGIHLPEWQLHHLHADGYVLPLHVLKNRMMLTAACHSEKALHMAARMGVKNVLISPVFQTESHSSPTVLGPIHLAQLARKAIRLGLTPYALGGITNANRVRRLKGSGIAGIAGISFLKR